MTALEAYHLFLLKVNRNDTQQRIAVAVPRFVALFREQALGWLDTALDAAKVTGDTKEYQYLLITEPLLPTMVTDTKVYFDLPSNYYQLYDGIVEAKRGTCTKTLYIYDLISLNNLQDSFTKPSFDWEETLYMLEGNKVKVLKEDFEILSLDLTYYKDPGTIDISGYKNTAGSPSFTIDPILIDAHTIEVINLCALEHIRSTSQSEDYQIAATRKNQ